MKRSTLHLNTNLDALDETSAKKLYASAAKLARLRNDNRDGEYITERISQVGPGYVKANVLYIAPDAA